MKNSKVVLKGPKGVGKSATLGALACISTCPTCVYPVHRSEGFVINTPTNGTEAPQSKKRKLEGGEYRLLVSVCVRVKCTVTL